MGEQVATKEEANNKEASPAPAPAEEKKDEAAPPPADQDPNKEEPPADPPSPPPPVPVILGVELHCTGCAKRIRRSLLRCKGVETVHVDMPPGGRGPCAAPSPAGAARHDGQEDGHARHAAAAAPPPPQPLRHDHDAPAVGASTAAATSGHADAVLDSFMANIGLTLKFEK
ncbi:hypothetical protein TRIUR3_19583 [Triticum urartu]|uniref:Uncharacterized protein n=1 Tax=Triticum urartu TaxID=4572 RepID=M7ZVE4_TRIUA|nr:hypothetical protein TRIUR3_19583 [Triticum urartu]